MVKVTVKYVEYINKKIAHCVDVVEVGFLHEDCELHLNVEESCMYVQNKRFPTIAVKSVIERRKYLGIYNDVQRQYRIEKKRNSYMRRKEKPSKSFATVEDNYDD